MKTVLTILLALVPAAVLAHPGHGAEPGSHWLSQPDHLAATVLAAFAAGEVLRRIVRRRERRDA
ncbi:DUF6732 family protein [Mangrovicoccus sp. HB161399]|uniref:DUF6732 family protein n=1 Tax=Mangrovicoccus sp. HB161399 TaxID=2720392 RepID=UPI0015531B24|nr:DUF6732 family protein [Mangrovicoccus sp. HB161399]